MISAGLVRRADELLFWILLGSTSLVAVVFLILFMITTRDFKNFLSDSDARWGMIERDSLFRFPTPAVIIGGEGLILWYNAAFREEIYTNESFGLPISDIVQVDLQKTRDNPGKMTEYFSGNFRLSAVTTEKTDTSGKALDKLTMLSFSDISHENALRLELESEMPDILVITVDNSEEIYGHEKESERTHIMIQLDKIIEEYAEKFGAVMRKTASDKYFTVISEAGIKRIIEDKFSILDEIRAIPLGEKSYVTVSIGVGKGNAEEVSARLITAENNAREALEMAQGRGGDQAVIKNGSDYEFFGGVSSGSEKNTKVKIRMVAGSLQNIAAGSSEIFIMGHKFGDMDCIGAAAGLAGALKLTYPETPIKICADLEHILAKQIVYRLMDNLPDGEELFISPEEAVEAMSDSGLLIIVDTNNKELLESYTLYEKSKNVIVIDHHRQTTHYVDNALLFHTEPYASSASEIVTEIIQYFNDIKRMSSYYADALLAGIMLDTKTFIMKTGSRTFEAAAFLRRQGADTIAVKKLFADSLDSIRKRSKLISSAEIYKHCAIASDDSGTPDSRVFSAQAADELLGAEEADASFVIFKTPMGVSISARSMGAMNVQIIMEKLGGGGHHTMAAAQLPDISVTDAKIRLIGAIDEHVANIT
jgi:c-di-AMP phosphodiesterase-like protein